MAHIVRHPDVKDYILELALPEIISRGGVADLFEQGKVILLTDYRLPFDFSVLDMLEKSIAHITDKEQRRQLKKVLATTFFEGEAPVRRSAFRRSGPALRFSNPVRQALFDVLCKGDPDLFHRASRVMESAYREMQRIFGLLFPSYEPFRFIPSLRLTRTLFENLHWDNHSIDEDFQQARVFANLDYRPRIWHTSHHVDDYARQIYDTHDLGRFAGKDPNALIDYITGDLMGGTLEIWKDDLPRHRIAFEPGEVWTGESRLVSHQIYYGEAAMVFMWFVSISGMVTPENRFNERLAALHREMAARSPVAAG